LGTEITIRQFADDDALQVKELFIVVNRLLSPPDLRDAFEAYIERALAEEIDRITAYYGQRDGGFWVAIQKNKVVGTFGLERASPVLWSCGVCMLILVLDGTGSHDRCFVSPKMNAAADRFSD
jgi:hypothetical protein